LGKKRKTQQVRARKIPKGHKHSKSFSARSRLSTKHWDERGQRELPPVPVKWKKHVGDGMHHHNMTIQGAENKKGWDNQSGFRACQRKNK